MSYLFAVEGLDSLTDIDNLPEEILTKARQAINRTADRARTDSVADIRGSLNFPARYLTDRLKVSSRSSGTNLSAVISGRDRPTSLARFSSSTNVQASRKRGYVDVKVGKSSKRMNGAFLINLRNNNIGLAIRLKPGESVKGKRVSAKEMAPGLFLLYGPSVDQAFRTIVNAGEVSKKAAAFLEREFIRLMGL